MHRSVVKSWLVPGLFWAGLLLGKGVLAATPGEFIDQARAAGIVEIESSRSAIQKTSATDINSFAVEMIKDHTDTNRHLAELAARLGLELIPVEQLEAQAGSAMLQAAEGEDFDAAYIAQQIEAHEALIKLFRQQAEEPGIPALQELAREALPKLEMHLEMAKKLQMTHRQDE